jgi:NAD(P)-binding Rossmann-like domain
MMPDFSVAIIGSGFAGIGMAARLKRAGVHDLVLLERGEALGGTWRDNSYPGAACDVPSHLYCFSFAPNPGWSRSFSPQPEIWDYLQRVADDEHVTGHIRFGRDVTAARWDADGSLWHIETKGPGGETGSLTARFLVSAAGPLSDPRRSSRRWPGSTCSSAHRRGSSRAGTAPSRQPNNFYPALTQPNVSVVTGGIAEIRDKSIVTRDGTEHEVGHSSQVFMIEAQIRYITGAVAHARRRGAVRVEVRPGAQAAYDRILQKKMKRTVWVTGGSKSWYLDGAGRNVTLWPDFTWAFAWQTRRFDAASYDIRLPHPQ